jgi:hypothetical protein
MPLKVVTGRANAGKTGRILSWAFASLARGGAATLIVPNLADVRRLQKEISGKAPLGVRVVTPAALALDLWQLYGDGRRPVGDATRSAVLRRILSEPIADDLASSASTPGFERLLVRTARHCAVAASEPGPGDARALVGRLLGRYRENLGDLGLIEPGWIASILADDLPAVGFLGFLRFTSFSVANLEMICSLAENNTVCAALNWEEGFAPTRANDAAAKLLISHAVEVRATEETTGNAELETVATKLRASIEPLVPTGSVVLGEARGGEAEAALVAAMVRREVREGTPPERIAVAFGQLAPRISTVRNALAAEGIDCSFDCPVTVGATAFGRALIDLLRLALGVGARAEAMQFLEGSFSDAEPVAVLRLDAGWRKWRQTEDSSRIMADIIRLGGDSGAVAASLRDISRRPLDAAVAKIWQIVADSLIATASAGNLLGLSAQDASAHQSVTRAVAEMASVAGSPFGTRDLLEALPTLVCSVASEESVGRVQVIQASHVGARRFDVLVIAGLTQAEFPLANRETFASEMHSLGAPGPRPSEEAMAELEFYSLLSRARDRLVLVRQTVSSDGAPLVASPLLEQVMDLYRGAQGQQGRSAEGGLSPEIVRMDDARAFVPVFTQGRREQRLSSEAEIPANRLVARGRISVEAGELVTQGRVFSATEIETYLHCPYSWFYSQVLRPRDIDSEMNAAALGSRAHRLISDFYTALKAEGCRRVTQETLPAALELFERSAEASEREMAPAEGLGEEIDAGRAHMWARHVVEDDAGLLPDYVPHAHELAFGDDSALEFGGVLVAGRIDRVDVGPAGAVVTDYKSARDVGKLARPGRASGIQHILYALAAEKLLGMPVVGSVYRSLRSRQLRGFWREDLLISLPSEACEKDALDAAGFSAMVEILEGRVGAAVEGMAAGEIPRLPQSADSCRYCALRQICEGALS